MGDMLNKIFNLIGTPSAVDCEAVSREDAKRYLKCFDDRKGDGFAKVFPHITKASLEMLEKTLVFSPTKRITVKAALEHAIFEPIRDPSKETEHGSLVVLDFEKEKDF